MHAEVRVADLEQHVNYYAKHFGMTLLERSGGNSATLGYGPGKFAVRVVQHDPQEGALDLGSGFGHFGIVLPVGGWVMAWACFASCMTACVPVCRRQVTCWCMASWAVPLHASCCRWMRWRLSALLRPTFLRAVSQWMPWGKTSYMRQCNHASMRKTFGAGTLSACWATCLRVPTAGMGH